MYKIIGKFCNEDISRELPESSYYAIGVYMAYVHNMMKYADTCDIPDLVDEAISVSRDVYENDLPHYYELADNMWLELRKE